MCTHCYSAARYRGQILRTWNPDRADAGPVREHLERLHQAGLRNFQIARLSGVDASVLSRLPSVEHVRRRTEERLLAVPVPDPSTAAAVVDDAAKVPSVGSIRRVQALVAFGYSQAELARQIGIDKANMRPLTGRAARDGKHTGDWVTAARHRKVAEVFDRLQLVPGPSQRARDMGARMGWALPFEWDEDTIDDPRAKPQRARWTPGSSRAERREQVADLTEAGLSAHEIAERLAVTPRTVERDRARHAAKTPEPQRDSEIEAMGAVAVQARRDIAARREAAPVRPSRRERTR